MAGEAQRIIDVINKKIYDNTQSGALERRTPGVIYETFGSGYEASAYVRVDDLISDVIVPNGVYVQAGDYVSIAQNDDGKAWIDRLIPKSMYSRLAIDFERRQILSGSGAYQPVPVVEFNDEGKMVDPATGELILGGGGGTVTQMRSIGASIKRTSAQSIATSTDTKVIWTNVDSDTDGFWTAALPTRLTIPANAPSGLYHLSFNGLWQTSVTSGNYRHARWYKNGSTISPNTGAPGVTGSAAAYGSSTNTITVWAVPGDYFEVNLWQDSTVSMNLGGADSWQWPIASIAYIGSGSAYGTAVQGTEISRSTTQSVTNGGTAAISFDTEIIDQGSWWASSPNPTRITVPTTGWYSYEARAAFDTPTTADTIMTMWLSKGGSTIVSATDMVRSKATYYSKLGVSGELYLSAGEYIEVYVNNGDSASKNILSGTDAPILRLVKMASGAEVTYASPYLSDAPSAAVYNSAAQSVATGSTPTVLTYNTVEHDTHGFYSAGTPNRFTIPAGHAGRYMITARTRIETANTGNRGMDIFKNGSAIASQVYSTPSGFDTWTLTASAVYLAVGDYVDFRVWQQTGGNINYGIAGYPGQSNRFTITRMAIGLQGEKGDTGSAYATSGLIFPDTQSPSSDAHTLDDYEEGTWTPNWYSTGGGSASSVTSNGRYQKIGNRVKLSGSLVAMRGTLGSGTMSITGLPFNPRSDGGLAWWAGSVGYFNGFISWTGYQPAIYVTTSTDTINVVAMKDGGTTLCDPTVNIPTGTSCHIIFAVEYEANA